MNPYILKRPLITEKTMRLANEQNTYTFEVAREATKGQIKAAVSELYGVKVVGVQTSTRNTTFKKTGKKRLKTKVAPVKKAMVKLTPKDKIELFDIYK